MAAHTKINNALVVYLGRNYSKRQPKPNFTMH